MMNITSVVSLEKSTFSTVKITYSGTLTSSSLPANDDHNDSSRLMLAIIYFCILVFLFFVWLIGSIGNAVVLIVLIELRLWQRDVLHAHMFVLTICDFIISFTGSPIIALAAWHRTWTLGNLACVIYAFVMNFVGIINILSLVVISLCRYSTLMATLSTDTSDYTSYSSCSSNGGSQSNPSVRKKYTNWHSEATIIWLTVCIVGFLAFIITSPPLVGWSQYEQEGVGISCSLRWYDDEHYLNVMSYAMYELIFGFCLPLTIILICHCQIVRRIDQHAKVRSGRQVKRAKDQVFFTVVAMTMAFVIAWLPYAVAAVFAIIGYGLSPWLLTMPSLFAKLSTAINPFVYVMSCNHIRQECLKKMPLFKILQRRQWHFSGTRATTSATIVGANGTSFDNHHCFCPELSARKSAEPPNHDDNEDDGCFYLIIQNVPSRVSSQVEDEQDDTNTEPLSIQRRLSKQVFTWV